MLHLIKDVSDYFCENAEKGTLGATSVSHEFAIDSYTHYS